MKTRYIAIYIIKEGYDEIGDRDLELDEYKEAEVVSLSQGIKECLNEPSGNGIGSVIEEEFINGLWWRIREHHVEQGKIYRTETYK